MPLIVTGSIGIDTVYTPDHGHRENVLGGSCAYFAAAASFFTPVRMVAAVGGDFPDELRAVLTRFKDVDVAGLETRAGSKSFRWGGKYLDDINQRDTLYTELGVLEEAPPPVPESYRDSEFVFLANTHPAAQLDLLRQFPKRRLAVADTMNLWIDIARPELTELLGRIDGLVLNYEEAEQFTGKRNTVAAARAILDFGPRFVVVKKGEHGCVYVHRDGLGAIPAWPAEEVVDPTGAGDSFAGGMMGAIAEACRADPELDPTSLDTLRVALGAGTVIASFCIESFSLDRLAGLKRADIADRLEEFASMTQIG
jgi:sugar/nucleoside kinase (ribokinase family)